MKQIRLPFLALLLVFALSARAEDIAAQLTGKLVALRGKSALPFAGAELAQSKYIALYYSAGWCGPCHQFTPDLVKFYNEMHASHPEFEIVFMSRDESSNAMEKYMGEMAMPWPAMRFGFVKNSRALNKYAGSGIPCLVLLNEQGEVLSDSYVNGKYVGPQKVMSDLKKLLAGDGGGIAQTELATPAAIATTAATPSGRSIKSPSGTNWDEVFKKKP